MLKPHALCVLTTDEFNIFLSRMGSLKLPIDYGATLAKHVANKKMGFMELHDYHMLMQQVLALCLQGLMATKP
jgi:hypothetical protein